MSDLKQTVKELVLNGKYEWEETALLRELALASRKDYIYITGLIRVMNSHDELRERLIEVLGDEDRLPSLR